MNPTEEQLKARLAATGYTQNQLNAVTPTTAINSPTEPISSADLGTTTNTNFQQPQEDPITNPNPVDPNAPATPEKPVSTPKIDDISTMITDAFGLQESVAGAGAYRNEQLQAQGLTPVIGEDGTTTYQNQTLVNLQNQLKKLSAESLQIPLQLQQDATGRGITAGGLQPIQTAALRNNAIASLGVQAQIAGQKDNIVLARNLVEQMVTVKFGADEAKLKAKLANIDLALKDPKIKAEEADRANAQALKLKREEAKIEQAKEDSTTIASWAIAMGKYTPTDPSQPKPTDLEIDNVMRLAKSDDPDKLKKALAIYAKYSNDPQATLQAANALELQRLTIQKTKDEIAVSAAKSPIEIKQAEANLRFTNANIAKVNADAAKTKKETEESGIPTNIDPKYKQAIDVILGSGTFTKDQKASVINAINSGQDPFTVIKNQAKNIMGQTSASALDKSEKTKDAMVTLQEGLKAFYDAGGDTGIFSGNFEKVENKLGAVSDPNLVDLAVQIASSLQSYRNAISGTAYSEQEGKDIAAVFPGITKGEILNNTIVKARLKTLNSEIDSAYRNTLGSTYDTLKGSATTVPSEIKALPKAKNYTDEDLLKAIAEKGLEAVKLFLK